MEQGPKCREEERKRKQQEKGMPIQPPNPEVVLPNNQDGDNPLVIPDREEDETRDDDAVRVMQAVSQHQNTLLQSDDSINERHLQGSKEETEARVGRDR